MPWSWVEEHGPSVRNGHGNWGAIDPIVGAADRHGLKLIPMLAFTPQLGAATRASSGPTPTREPFEDFFAAALRRYPQIPAWELWNEPNFARFSKPRPDPAALRGVPAQRAPRARQRRLEGQADLGRHRARRRHRHHVLDQRGRDARRAEPDRRAAACTPTAPPSPDDPRSWMMQLRGAARPARRARQARPAALADRVRRADGAGRERLRAGADRAAAGRPPADRVRARLALRLDREPHLVRVPRQLRRPDATRSATSASSTPTSRPSRPTTRCAR